MPSINSKGVQKMGLNTNNTGRGIILFEVKKVNKIFGIDMNCLSLICNNDKMLSMLSKDKDFKHAKFTFLSKTNGMHNGRCFNNLSHKKESVYISPSPYKYT